MAIDDEEPQPLDDGAYLPEEDGVFELSFLILDKDGEIICQSKTYTLMLDRVPPVINEVDAESGDDYSMTVDASDALSGLDAYSVDGGMSWITLESDDPFVYTAEEETTIEAGLLLVRDRANNTAVWQEEIILTGSGETDPTAEPTATPKPTGVIGTVPWPFDDPEPTDGSGEGGGGGSGGGSSGGGGGGGSGSSGSGSSQPHSSGSGTTKHDYDQVSVAKEDENAPMHKLTLDGEELDLTLSLDEAHGDEYTDEYEAVFLVDMGYWEEPPIEDEEAEEGDEPTPSPSPSPTPSPMPSPSPTPSPTPDPSASPTPVPPVWAVPEGEEANTMVLMAELDEAVLGEESYQYCWTINGSVLRQLSKSGVTYLVLKVGDLLTAFPTEGFLAGDKYTELKMQGVSTRRFQYDIVMRYSPYETTDEVLTDSELFSLSWRTDMYVTVESETIRLSEDELAAMYMTNVCVGPEDMMTVPYGTWVVEEEIDDEELEEE